MITVEEARNIVVENLKVLDIQQSKLQESAGRVLSEDIPALFPMPRFDNSAMDGFAVRAVDTADAEKDNAVTIRDRDSMEQTRIPVEELIATVTRKLSM